MWDLLTCGGTFTEFTCGRDLLTCGGDIHVCYSHEGTFRCESYTCGRGIQCGSLLTCGRANIWELCKGNLCVEGAIHMWELTHVWKEHLCVGANMWKGHSHVGVTLCVEGASTCELPHINAPSTILITVEPHVWRELICGRFTCEELGMELYVCGGPNRFNFESSCPP